jgi:uncharacterized protein YoxC
MNHDSLLVVFIAITGAAVLLQAIILFAFYLTVRKTTEALQAQVEDMRSSVLPVLKDSQQFLARVGPKIESVAGDLEKLTYVLHVQSVELHSTVAEILERVRRQTSRVDGMLTNVLDGVDRAGGFVVEAVNLPIRQLSALTAAAKAIVGALRTKSAEPRQTHSPADKDQFI